MYKLNCIAINFNRNAINSFFVIFLRFLARHKGEDNEDADDENEEEGA